MKVIEATVKFPAGKEFSNQFGVRQNVKFVSTGGEEINLWFNAGEQRYCQLKRGDRVQLIQDGEKFSLVDSEPSEQPPTPSVTPAALASSAEVKTNRKIKGLASMNKDIKAEVFEEMCKRSQFLRSCHVQIVSSFTNAETGECVISEATIQKYVMTLYIDMKDSW